MNHTKKILILLLILVSTISYSQYDAQDIYGNWEINFAKTKDLMTPDQLSRFNALSADDQSATIAQLENQEFIFNSNAGFTALYNGNSQNGTWTLNGDDLAITFSSGTTVTHKILTVSATVIDLKIVHDPTSQALFHKLSLTRKVQ